MGQTPREGKEGLSIRVADDARGGRGEGGPWSGEGEGERRVKHALQWVTGGKMTAAGGGEGGGMETFKALIRCWGRVE